MVVDGKAVLRRAFKECSVTNILKFLVVDRKLGNLIKSVVLTLKNPFLSFNFFPDGPLLFGPCFQSLQM